VLTLDKAVAQAYAVNKVPTILALDPDGRELGRTVVKPAETGKFLEESLAKYPRGVFWAESLAEARKRAERDRKPIVALVEDSRVAKTIESKGLKDLHGKFVWARIALEKESEDLKELGAAKAGQIAVVDGKVLGMEEPKTEKEILAFLGRFTGEKK